MYANVILSTKKLKMNKVFRKKKNVLYYEILMSTLHLENGKMMPLDQSVTLMSNSRVMSVSQPPSSDSSFVIMDLHTFPVVE